MDHGAFHLMEGKGVDIQVLGFCGNAGHRFLQVVRYNYYMHLL